MVRNSFIITGILSLFLAVYGCNLSGDEKDLVVRIDEEFSINLNEKLGNYPSLVFETESVEPVSCLNSTIDQSVTFGNNQLQLFIKNIDEQEDCIPGESPARGKAYAGPIPNGQYTIRINIRNAVINEGVITVEHDRFVVSLGSDDGLAFKNRTLLRVPDQLIWGYLAFDDESEAGPYPDLFLQDIMSVTSHASLTEGYYGHFEWDGAELKLRETPEKSFVQTFHFFYLQENVSQLEDLLEHYRSQSGGNITFRIFTWQGNVL